MKLEYKTKVTVFPPAGDQLPNIPKNMAKVLTTRPSLKFLLTIHKFMLIMNNIYDHFKSLKKKKITFTAIFNFFGQNNYRYFNSIILAFLTTIVSFQSRDGATTQTLGTLQHID